MLVHVLEKFSSDWAIYFLFVTSNVHTFLINHIFYWPAVVHLIPLLYLIPNLQIACTFEQFICFIQNGPSLEIYKEQIHKVADP